MAMSDRLLVHEADPFIVQVDEVGQFQWPDGGFQRWEGSSQTILLARRAPTMKRWSLDARSKGQPWPLP